MKKRLMAAVLLLALVLCAFSAPALATESVSFVAVNDTIPLTLPAGSAPYQAAAGLYVPYTVFDASPGGIVSSYNAQKQTFVLLTREKILLFDLDKSTVTDEKENTSRVLITYRNGILYVPAELCASHFGLKVTLLTSRGGYPVLRFTNGSEVYDNDTLLSKAENLISYRVEVIENESAQAQRPEDTNKPPVQPADPASVYLAITDAISMRASMQALEKRKLRGAFFLTEEEILADRELVRELYAAGHRIGLTVSKEEEDPQQALRRANDALDAVISSKSVMALLEPAQTPKVSGYRIFERPAERMSNARIVAAPDQPRLLCTADDTASVIDSLVTAGITVRTLRETTVVIP